jgi:metallophosphoesterase superfamily enzyme
VLPAFSAFTGGTPIRLAAGEAAVACNGEALVEVRRATSPG